MRQLFNMLTVTSAGDPDRSATEIRGSLERITFHNEENGYFVGRLLPAGKRDVVTITGTFSRPAIGEVYICRGYWTVHQQFGAQFQVQSYEIVRPVTSGAIEKYIGSGMVKGVGPITAKRIVTKFGDRSLDVIEKTPDELLTVPGIGSKTVDMIKAAWGVQSDVRGIMIFLQSHGVSPAYAAKIYKTYQRQSIEVVASNPYRLASEIWGIGFKMADQIARNLGFAVDDLRRIEAGLVYILGQATETGGNLYLTVDELVNKSAEILGPHDIQPALQNLLQGGRLIREDLSAFGVTESAIYHPQLYEAELLLAKRIKQLVERPVRQPNGNQMPYKDDTAKPLTDEQAAAVHKSQESRVLILTGGPGVGKTTTTNAIVKCLKSSGKRVLLASPTGRASKRLSEVTGCEAVTIHRLLAYDPQTREFQRNADSPLECDALLVDESSMLDTPLASALVAALPNNSQLILVGDVDQLPSVGPGNVLNDLIASTVVPVVRLTKVFRQASKSMIIAGAHAINSGNIPVMASPKDGEADFVFINADEGSEVTDKVVAIVARSLVKRGYPTNEVQVLAPMQRGSAGSIELNMRLQQAVNPPGPLKPEIQRGARLFRLGDRVIQLRNNYEKQVYNGDIGMITEANSSDSALKVKFDSRQVPYEQAELDELGLAYSLSIHKSQGSEFPVVVIALHTQHYTLLQRNLIYTALTRARKLAVLVGSKKALAMAVNNNKQSQRHTRLKQRLLGLI